MRPEKRSVRSPAFPLSRPRGHLPTYIAIPLATGAFFFVAAFTAVMEIAQANTAAAAALAAGWIVLYVLMHYGDGLEQFACLAAAFATMVAGGIAAKAYAADLSTSEAVLRLAITGTVMSVLAAINTTILLRQRQRNAGT